MGQQAALSGILRGQNKPTSRDSYEAMGQQKGQRNESHPAVEPGHVKNSKSRFQTDRKIPSENEGKSSDFTPYGMAVKALIDSASDRILGFSAFGAEAGEVMASVQVAMIAELPFTALRDAIFTHPTMAEGLIPLFSNVTPTSAPVRNETRVLSGT